MRRFAWHFVVLWVVCGWSPAGARSPAAMFRGGGELTGQFEAISVAQISAVRFAFQAGGPIRSTPAVDHGTLYVGSSDGVFHALDANSGRERWRVQTAGAITSSPAVAGTRVFFASRDGYLFCLATTNGKTVWKYRFGHDVDARDYWDFYLSSPVIVGDMLLIGSGDGHVRAIALRDGAPRWTFDAGARVRTTIAVHGDFAVFGTSSGHAYALNLRNGALRWRFATQGASQSFAEQGNDTTSIMASPTIAGDIVAVGGRDGNLYGLDLVSGRERWHATHDGSSWMLSTAYDGETLYVGGGSAQIVQALDPRNGTERWRFKTRGAVFSAVALAGDSVVAGDFSGTLFALDKATGQLRWQFPLGARTFSSPVAAEGVLYSGQDNGVLLALSLAASAGPDRALPKSPVRIVYWDAPAKPAAFHWFQNGVDAALLAALKAAGYQPMDRGALLDFLGTHAGEHPASVIVFADNRMPAELGDGQKGVSPIRRYLDTGGKVVVVGASPLAYVEDPETGELTGLDFTVPQRIFDVRYADPQDANGYFASTPTTEGRALGLRTTTISASAVDSSQPIAVLARDEFGRASAWQKSYGGRSGTGLLQLTLPRQQIVDYGEFLAPIEYGIGW